MEPIQKQLVITGASSGIGRACVSRMAQAGENADVVNHRHGREATDTIDLRMRRGTLA